MPMTHINAVKQVAKFVRLKDNRIVFLTTGSKPYVFGSPSRGIPRAIQFSHLDEVPEKEVKDWEEAKKMFGDWIDEYKP